MRFILNFFIAIGRLSDLALRPVLLALVVELLILLLNINGFDFGHGQ